MHKKKISGISYYYTSVREKGKVKTVYLGKDKSLAKKNELSVKKPRKPVRKFFGLFLLFLTILLLGPNFTGYATYLNGSPIPVTATLRIGEFIPNGSPY